jgi:hypothetical protein
MTIKFIIKGKIIIHKLDLHQENGQKDIATIIKKQKVGRERNRRRLEQLQKAKK